MAGQIASEHSKNQYRRPYRRSQQSLTKAHARLREHLLTGLTDRIPRPTP